MQLYSRLKTRVQLEKQVDPLTLSNVYDFVVVATGITTNMNIAKKLGLWEIYIDAWVKSCIVQGSFDPGTTIIWRNKSIFKNGFAYLTPFNDKRATLAIVVDEIMSNDLDHYWDLFFQKEGLDYNILDFAHWDHTIGKLSRYDRWLTVESWKPVQELLYDKNPLLSGITSVITTPLSWIRNRQDGRTNHP